MIDIFTKFSENYGNEASVIALLITLSGIIITMIVKIKRYLNKLQSSKDKYRSELSALSENVSKTADVATTQAKRQEVYLYFNAIIGNIRETIVHSKIEYWGLLNILILSTLIYMVLFIISESSILFFIASLISLIGTIVFIIVFSKIIRKMEEEKDTIYNEVITKLKDMIAKH